MATPGIRFLHFPYIYVIFSNNLYSDLGEAHFDGQFLISEIGRASEFEFKLIYRGLKIVHQLKMAAIGWRSRLQESLLL